MGKILKNIVNSVKDFGGGLIKDSISQTANGLIQQMFAEKNRSRNFYWNEKAADSADQRQRKQYEDLYSPQAMLKQYAAAGLSPSMMMSGGQSAVGSSSAQGNMSAGIQGPYPSAQPTLDPMLSAQIANLNADTEGKRFDNTVKEIETELRKKSSLLESTELDLLGMTLIDQETNEHKSLFDIATNYSNYKEFTDYIEKDTKIENNSLLKQYIKTTAGQKTLQDIYKSAHNIDKEVAQIEGDKEYANIMLKTYQRLNQNDFAKLSADERLSELRKIVQNNNLEADKKKTINDIFNGIENENLRSFLMVLYMLGDRYLGSLSASYNANNNTITKK